MVKTKRTRSSAAAAKKVMSGPWKGNRFAEEPSEEEERPAESPASEAPPTVEEEEEEEQQPSRPTKRKTTEVDYADIREEAVPRKTGLKFSEEDEEQMLRFLKNRPSLYETGTKQYLVKSKREARLEVWEELERDFDKPDCTADNFEKWYWSIRTLYGKLLQKPPSASVPGTKRTRAQFVFEECAFLKNFIVQKARKDEQPVSSLSAARPSTSARPSTPVVELDEDEEWTMAQDEEGESDERPAKARKTVFERTDQLTSSIASQISHNLADPEERGRKMIMDGHFMEVLRKMPANMWLDFQEEFHTIMIKYRRRLMDYMEELEDAKAAGLPLIHDCGGLPMIRTPRPQQLLAFPPPQLQPVVQPPQLQPVVQPPQLQPAAQPPQLQPAAQSPQLPALYPQQQQQQYYQQPRL